MDIVSVEDLIHKYKRELRIRKYSPKTIDMYARMLQRFMEYCRLTPEKDREERIRDWLDHFGDKEASRLMAFASLKFFYHEFLKIPLAVFSMHRKRRRSLPAVLSKHEVQRLLGAVRNPKHRLMLSLMYGSGLRVGELVALDVGDVDIASHRLHVRHGKGDRDRFVALRDPLRPAVFDPRGAGGLRKGFRPHEYPEEVFLSHIATLLRHASFGTGHGYSGDSGAAGPSELEDHDDLHASDRRNPQNCSVPAG